MGGRLSLIEASGWSIAFDGCHKLYFLQDDGEVRDARDAGYRVFPASRLRELYDSSCGLRFVSRWGRLNGDFYHPWNIKQFEDEDQVALPGNVTPGPWGAA